mmetsp:Transcript_27604/g.62445  ORF Transcript_27604/g.62445 Transcript_27604/m.62445 type:complete len:329 (+) Transcript_27604:70-1056(+)
MAVYARCEQIRSQLVRAPRVTDSERLRRAPTHTQVHSLSMGQAPTHGACSQRRQSLLLLHFLQLCILSRRSRVLLRLLHRSPLVLHECLVLGAEVLLGLVPYHVRRVGDNVRVLPDDAVEDGSLMVPLAALLALVGVRRHTVGDQLPDDGRDREASSSSVHSKELRRERESRRESRRTTQSRIWGNRAPWYRSTAPPHTASSMHSKSQCAACVAPIDQDDCNELTISIGPARGRCSAEKGIYPLWLHRQVDFTAGGVHSKWSSQQMEFTAGNSAADRRAFVPTGAEHMTWCRSTRRSRLGRVRTTPRNRSDDRCSANSSGRLSRLCEA